MISEVVQLKPEHLRQIEPRRYETETADAASIRFGQMTEIISLGPAFTFYKDGKIAAICGLANVWGSVWEAWLISTQYMDRYVARDIKKTLLALEDKLGHKIVRLQAQAPISHPSAHRWIQWLGLEKETELKSYTINNEDVIIYSRIKKWV